MPWRRKEFRECLRRGLLARTRMQKPSPCNTEGRTTYKFKIKGRATRPVQIVPCFCFRMDLTVKTQMPVRKISKANKIFASCILILKDS